MRTYVYLPEARPTVLCGRVGAGWVNSGSQARQLHMTNRGMPRAAFPLFVQFGAGSFYTEMNVLDPHSLIWRRKNSPYLTVAILTGRANYVGRKLVPHRLS